MNEILDKLQKTNLKHSLDANGYICDNKTATKIELSLITSSDAGTKGAWLRGPVGVGKTFLVDTLAKIFDIPKERYIRQQLFTRANETDIVATLMPTDDKKSGFEMYKGALVQAAEASQKGPTFVLFDEWDKTMPSTDSTLLDFLQTGKIKYKNIEVQANRDNLYFYATMNDERPLGEAAERRLKELNFEYMLPDVFVDALASKRPNASIDVINKCRTIYLQTIGARLKRIATVQECAQMIDSMYHAGGSLTMDDYVRMHITKNDNNHNQFVKYITSGQYHPNRVIQDTWGEKYQVKDSVYDDKDIDIDTLSTIQDKSISVSPMIDNLLKKHGTVPDSTLTEDVEELDLGYVDYTDKNYHQLASEAKDLYGDEGILEVNYTAIEGDKKLTFAKRGERLYLVDPIHIVDYEALNTLLKRKSITGAIKLYGPEMKREDVIGLAGRTVKTSECVIYRKEANKVVVGLDNKTVIITWERGLGAVVTFDTKYHEYLTLLLGAETRPQSKENNLWLNYASDLSSFFSDSLTKEEREASYGLAFIRHLPKMDIKKEKLVPKKKKNIDDVWSNTQNPNEL